MGGFFNALGWIWNHFWGALLVIFGLAAIFTNVEGVGIWGGLLSIGVGIYFMW